MEFDNGKKEKYLFPRQVLAFLIDLFLFIILYHVLLFLETFLIGIGIGAYVHVQAYYAQLSYQEEDKIGYSMLDTLLDSYSYYVIIGVQCLFISALLEASWWQATLGKKLLKLQVVNNNLGRISLKQSIVRNLLKFICFWGIRFRPGTSVHDRVSGTKVMSRITDKKGEKG